MKCPYCGREVNEGNAFCIGCGAKVDNQPVAKKDAFSYQPPKKSNTGLIVTIIIISVLVVAGIILAIVLLTGGSGKNNNSASSNNEVENKNSEKGKEYSSSELSKNIKYRDYVLGDDTLLLELTNNNDIEVSFKVYIDYYDSNGDVDEDHDSFYILEPGDTSYMSFYSYDKEYKDYKIKIVAESNYYYVSHRKDIKIDSNVEKSYGGINVSFTNNADIEVSDVEISALFYKGGQLVGYDSDFEIDIASGGKGSSYLSYPYDSDYNDIEFDDYKLVVNTAYTYKDLDLE